MTNNSMVHGLIENAVARNAAVDRLRLTWLDVAKGIGIIFVVIGHALGGIIDSNLDSSAQMVYRSIFSVIYFFHMPMFFILSGLLVQTRLRKDPRKFRRSLIIQIAYPYFLWSIIQYSVIYLSGGLVNHPVDSYWSTILLLPIHTVSQFWFFYALFVLHVMSALLLERVGPTSFFLITLMIKSSALIFAIASPWHEIALMSAYYGIGILLGVEGLKAVVIDQPLWVRLYLLPVLSAIALGATYSALLRDVTPIAFAQIESAAIAHKCWSFAALFAALASTGAVLGIATILPAILVQVLAYLGQMSLAIFVLHIIFVAGSRILLTNVFKVNDVEILMLVIVSAGLVGPLLARSLANRLGLAAAFGLA